MPSFSEQLKASASPVYITKYFESRFLRDVCEGSFKIGSSVDYRKQESNEFDKVRFGDDREGLVVRNIHAPYNTPINFSHNGIHIENFTFGGGVFMREDRANINDLVFCCTNGAYDPVVHAQIMNGGWSDSGKWYPGNKDLTHYAVIDRDRFQMALLVAVINSPQWSTSFPIETFRQNGVQPFLLAKPVIYGDPFEHRPYHQHLNDDLTEEDYIRTLFVKPKFFSVEREYRIVVRPNSPSCIPNDDTGLVVQSAALKSCIIGCGGPDGLVLPPPT